MGVSGPGRQRPAPPAAIRERLPAVLQVMTSSARRQRLSTPTRGALLALALVLGGSAGGALADRDRPLPRRLAARIGQAGELSRPGLARAVFGVG
jgi:hypothetical protein